jgi:hypothetical protein
MAAFILCYPIEEKPDFTLRARHHTKRTAIFLTPANAVSAGMEFLTSRHTANASTLPGMTEPTSLGPPHEQHYRRQ